MQTQQQILNNFPTIDRFGEDAKYNQRLYAVTLFPYNTELSKANLYRIVLNFSFREINFNKKQALPFFLALELLTRQKCIVTLSSKNVLFWKLRKGMLVGCKVTLRNKNLEDFFDSLAIVMPRMEKFKPTLGHILKHKKAPTVSLSLVELIFFYPFELGLGVNTNVTKVDLHFLFNILTPEEKIFLLTSKRIPITV